MFGLFRLSTLGMLALLLVLLHPFNGFLLTGLLISGGMLMRLTMIMLGWLKGPVLVRFEKYGDEEDFFYPLPRLCFWLGLSTIFTSLWVANITQLYFPGEAIGVLVLAAGFVLNHFSDYARAHPNPLLIYPHWLLDLFFRTSRLERRRIAYMWLRLPWRTRLFYNGNDRAFLQWADSIIIATLY
ncbi:MAG: hypothetical protein HC915_21035 [Anaerolineae bacterium]|nr:hypothetical protein [Anaerolineae bacterium]